MSNYERRPVGSPLHDLGNLLDQPKPPALADLLNAQNKVEERANKARIEAAIAAQEAEKERNRIPLD